MQVTNLTLKQLRYLVAVDDLKHFRKAAEACHVSQPSLSVQIQNIEDVLGVQLVERGQIDLDVDVNGYLDFEIPPFEGAPVTMRQLLTHTAGFESTSQFLFIANPMTLGDYVTKSLPQRVYVSGSTPASLRP